MVHFRYSERGGAGGGGSNLPFSLEGLCAHHGQTLAAQLAGTGSGGGSGGGGTKGQGPVVHGGKSSPGNLFSLFLSLVFIFPHQFYIAQAQDITPLNTFSTLVEFEDTFSTLVEFQNTFSTLVEFQNTFSS